MKYTGICPGCQSSLIGVVKGDLVSFTYRTHRWTRGISYVENRYPNFPLTCDLTLRIEIVVLAKSEEPPLMKLNFSNLTLGCDPEFAGILNGKRMNFRDLLPFEGKLGWDHGGNVAEIRPAPAKNARTVVKHIREIMQDAPANVRAGRWRGGAKVSDPENYLGGHIHLAIGEQRLEDRLNIINALNAFSHNLYLLDILPMEENKARVAAKWGRPGNVRHCWHNNISCMEYRTMCSWLFDPKVALIALTGAKCAAIEPEFTIETLTERDASHRRLYRFFKAFEDKCTDAAYIEEKILSNKLTAQLEVDIQDAWELEPRPKVT